MEFFTAYTYVLVFIFGTIIGSFLNVVLYRMHTGKSLSGHSHCLSCSKRLSWHELIPILSYMLQRGRCRGCSSYVPVRYLVTEVLTGVLVLLVWVVYYPDLILVFLYALLMTALVVVAIYDVRHTIIPDEWVLGLSIIALFIIAQNYLTHQDIKMLGSQLAGGGAAAAFFATLWFVSKGRWIGFGDVKLAFPLGLIVGLGSVFSLLVLSFWIGTIVSLAVIGAGRVLLRGKNALHFRRIPLTMKSEIPFAPFLIAAFVGVQLFHANVFSITSFFFAY